jgi:hypothetical protein
MEVLAAKAGAGLWIELVVSLYSCRLYSFWSRLQTMKKDCTLSSISAPPGFCSYKPTSLNVDSSILLHGYTDVRARADMLKFPQTPCSLIRSRCSCLDDGWHFLIPSGETSTHRQYAIEAYTCRSRWLVNPLRFRTLWLAGGTGLCSGSPNMETSQA